MLGFGRKKSKVVFQQPGFRLLQRLSMPAVYKGLLLVATCLVTAYLIAPSMPSTIPAYQIGDIADQNIRATEDVLVEDTASTANNFGEIPADNALEGRVWLDLNNNGVIDGTTARMHQRVPK